MRARSIEYSMHGSAMTASPIHSRRVAVLMSVRDADRAQRSFILRDRPHLDAADPCARYSGRHLDRLAHVSRFDQIIAAELLLGLGVRAVRGPHFAVPNAHGRRRIGCEQPIAADKVTAPSDFFGED